MIAAAKWLDINFDGHVTIVDFGIWITSVVAILYGIPKIVKAGLQVRSSTKIAYVHSVTEVVQPLLENIAVVAEDTNKRQLVITDTLAGLNEGQSTIKDALTVTQDAVTTLDVRVSAFDETLRAHLVEETNENVAFREELGSIAGEMRKTFERRSATFEASIGPWRDRFTALETGHEETHAKLDAMARHDEAVADKVIEADEAHEEHLTQQDEAIEVVRDQTSPNERPHP